MKKALVISPAVGMEAAELQPFLSSLKKAGVEADVILLRLRSDAPLELGKDDENINFKYYCPISLSVQLALTRLIGAGRITRLIGLISKVFGIRGQKACPYFMHIHLSRHFHARDIIRKSGTAYDYVAMLDTRDIIIQTNPFAFLNPNKIVVAEEDSTIAGEPTNLFWIEFLNKKFKTSKISVDNTIICAGAIIGGRIGFLNYLDEMCKYCHEVGGAVGNTGGFDQGILNVVLRQQSSQSFVQIQPSGKGPICHLGENWIEHYTWDERRGLLDADGVTIAIVHQYDRKLRLVELYSTFLGQECYEHQLAKSIAENEKPLREIYN